jgi:ParB family transcriptional regulator, chromosome partitioning protein
MPKKPSRKVNVSREKSRKKLALGRGLDALLPEIEPVESRFKDFFQCDVTLIQPNRYQPRKRFNDAELEDLSRSIKEKGILQPLIVRKSEAGYELVAGERRLRAAKLAGLKQVPVVIKQVTETELLEMSIIENIQREDLNPMEEAEAYQRLIAEFDLTQDNLADRIGKSRSTVANFLRLRQLPEQIKSSLMEDVLSMGHARALLGAETPAQQLAAWRTVISKNLSVRETEALIKRIKKERKKSARPEKTSEERYLMDIADHLSRRFGTKVLIKKRGEKGKIEIDFFSGDDLDRLLTLLEAE